ncbi:hypothetical protein [Psychrobacillus phage Perkons]|nr:hypothetical protein [Psychrobacillus phage Perkons]
MSLNAININVMVFSDTSEKAYEYMEKLVDDTGEIIISKNERNRLIVTETKRYQATYASPHARGYRYTEVHVDRCLAGTDIFHELILTKLVPPHYYLGAECDDEYNWRDHVHYFN